MGCDAPPGTAGRPGAWNDQCCSGSGSGWSTAGGVAPELIHVEIAAACSDVSARPSGGMRTSASVEVTRRIISLAGASPGTAAGPEAPPRKRAATVSSRRPASCLSAPWQEKQRSWRIGRT